LLALGGLGTRISFSSRLGYAHADPPDTLS
jgi:hypothetical protein